MELPDVERIGFGVIADKDEHAPVFSHSDRFWIVDLKRRKEVIWSEYRDNPYVQTCKEKYPNPSAIGDHPCDEELEIYRKIGEMLKDCKYVSGQNFGNYAADALEAAGTEAMMNFSHQPQEWVDSLIEARGYAGYRD
ncbi:MAG: hypothetical protein DRQ49_01205 [Gammaproteobacteria bacterium]|nr:MAG: hypothetical protein DRQ41_06995 [Gammaproteobacteria bacterium]RKZ42705.1 MAG: hypothetical protein DRQ49_01205 [Gammaproteobacteria bacterium]RKZ74207.1 MAG: hypothetical protein DRQ57_11895 [Gammaproteobacteria bacterium]